MAAWNCALIDAGGSGFAGTAVATGAGPVLLLGLGAREAWVA